MQLVERIAVLGLVTFLFRKEFVHVCFMITSKYCSSNGPFLLMSRFSVFIQTHNINSHCLNLVNMSNFIVICCKLIKIIMGSLTCQFLQRNIGRPAALPAHTLFQLTFLYKNWQALDSVFS